MEHWHCNPSDGGIPLDSALVCQLLNAIGHVDHTTMANAVLDLVSSHVPMADCSVMAFETGRVPRAVSVFSHTDNHQIFHCASNYTRRLYQHDRIQLHLQSILPQLEIGQVIVHRQTLTQIIDRELRQLYHTTLEIVDSIAITIKTAPQAWITTSLCRHRAQGQLDKQEIEAALQLASLIATSVSRHCRLEADSETGQQTSMRDGIEQLCSQLTKRERQVILRILDGVTVERIASELELKPSTVVTYRSRAYEKLGISSRRELFSTVLNNRKAAAPWEATDDRSCTTGPLYASSTGTDRPYQ